MGEHTRLARRRGVLHRIRPTDVRSAIVWLAIATLMVLGATTAYAAHTLNLFELDGNTANGVAPGEDWDSVYASSNNTDRIFITDASGRFDDAYTGGGSKDINDIPSWLHSQGGVPDKDDLLHAFAVAYPSPTSPGRQAIYFGADRFAQNGASEIGFWFFQQDVGLNADGTFEGVHTVGDILVLANFTTGGKVNQVDIYRWVGGADPLALVAERTDCAETAGEVGGCGIVNSAPITPAWPYTPKQGPAGQIPAGGLFEGGIDPAGLGLAQRCFSSFMATTRTSHETNSQLKDFALGNFDTCSSITVEKQTDPDGAAGNFGFTLSPDPNSVGTRTLSDNGSYKFDRLSGGTYELSESSLPAGWDLTNISCDGGSPSYNLSTRKVTLTLAGIQNVKCTFNNTQRGQITVEKATNPASTQPFSFAPSWTPTFSLSNGQSNTSNPLVPGTYSVSETVPTGWDLTSATCDDGSPVTAIDLGAGEHVTCTFTNTQRGQITVEKATNPASTQLFSFAPSWTPTFSLSNGQSNTSNPLVPGTYSVSETVPTGWDLTSATCDDGSPVTAIDLGAGEHVTCTFTNTQRGKVTIKKVTNPTTSTQEFDFTSTAIVGGFSLGHNDTKTSEWIVPGTYSASETVPTGWDLTSATCDDGSPVTAIDLGAGEHVTCTFTNTQRGKAEVIKTTNGAPAAAGAWTFTLKGPGVDVTDSTDANGDVDFNGATLTPNVSYTICEVDIPAGWTSVWTGYTPYNPHAPLEDLGSRCVDFSVDPGATKTFTVDNVAPRGDARTIGYWKNWNNCSGGRQGQMAAAKGMKILEDYLPQLIGDLYVTGCADGVKILSKQDLSGKNMSSDAAYNLAAQLLAAKLNLAADAGSCTAATNAVVAGQALLDTINFTGTGNYLPSKSKDPNRALALSLAATLDSYNNNTLCP